MCPQNPSLSREFDYENFEDFHQHEKIVELQDKKSGLRGFIAIHSTVMGPGIGGTRMFAYETTEEAIRDVLRLSYAMTYKCAISKLPLGGAKGVIIGDSHKDKTPEILKAYAKAVDKLQGEFYTGEDVGLSEEDVQYMLKFSPYFVGKSDQAGDPSAFAALSVFKCIQATLLYVNETESLDGKTVAIKGLGKTGAELVRLVLENKGNVIAAEINSKSLDGVVKKYPQIRIVSPDQISEVEADIYAPCALGDEITEENHTKINARIICGTANNQLQNANVGELIFKAGKIYVPDYLANAGGLINVADELEPGGYNRVRVLQRIEELKSVCRQVLDRSIRGNIPTNMIADEIAQQFIAQTKLQHTYGKV